MIMLVFFMVGLLLLHVGLPLLFYKLDYPALSRSQLKINNLFDSFYTAKILTKDEFFAGLTEILSKDPELTEMILNELDKDNSKLYDKWLLDIANGAQVAYSNGRKLEISPALSLYLKEKYIILPSITKALHNNYKG